MNDAIITERLIEIIRDMTEDERKALMEDLSSRRIKKTRANERIECLVPVDYAVKGRAYQNFIQDISTSGAFIETGRKFAVGDEVLLTISYANEVRPFKITGEVVRIDPSGIGVRFRKLSQVQEEIIGSIIMKLNEAKSKRIDLD